MPSKYVLVIDDEMPALHLIELYLGRYGIQTLTAYDSESAFALLSQHSDDIGLILLDIALPGMNGFDICRKIRFELGLSAVPIVAITASLSINIDHQAHEAGFNEVIFKPFHANTLERVLSAHGMI